MPAEVETTMTNASAGHASRPVYYGHSFAPDGDGARTSASAETTAPNARGAGAHKGASAGARGNRAEDGQDGQHRDQAIGRHTQANYRAAKKQGRRRNNRYPARRIAGLHYAPKLTVDDVHDIRRSYRYRSKDANMRVLAERFGVSVAAIFKIIRGKMWRFVPTANAPQSREPRNQMTRLTKKACAALEGTLAALAALNPANPDLRALIHRYEMTAQANAVP